MVTSLRLLGASLLLSVLLIVPVLAQDSPQAGLQQIPLTQDVIKRFMSSFPKLIALGKKYESQAPQGADTKSSPGKVMTAYMTSVEARTEMQKTLQDNGFKDFGEWTKIATSVALAYGYAKSGKDPDEIAAQMDKATEKIKNNSKMPEAQKKQVIAMMRQQAGLLAPLPGNVEIAKSMLDELKPVMEME